MDRRLVWFAVLLPFAIGRPAGAMQGLSDPSAQGPVGFAPIRSIDQINGHPSVPGTAPASAALPAIGTTNPTASGPSNTLPIAPGGDDPVGLTPLPPLQKSLERGYRFGRVSDLFRKEKPAAVTPAGKPRPARTDTKPTPNAWSPDAAVQRAGHPYPVQAPSAAPPKARPAPFGDQAPDGPRRQLELPVDPDAAASPTDGRPNPLALEQPPRARARLAADPGGPTPRPAMPSTAEYRPQGSRPQAGMTVAEAAASGVLLPAAVEVPPPDIVLPPPPALEPGPARLAEPPALAPPLEAVPIDPATPTPTPEPPPIVEPSPAVAPEPLPPVEPAPMPIVEPVAAADAPLVAPEPLPPIEPAPLPIPVLAAAPGPDPASISPSADPAVTRTGADSTAIRMKAPMGKDTQFATLRAAAVGDEVITIHELMVAVNERIHDYVDPSQPVPPEELKKLKNQVAPYVLKQLVDQSLLLQEAKRMMKNEKNLKAFNEFTDKVWKDDELPPLLRQTRTSTEFELKLKLAEQGKSYDGMKAAFRKKMLAQDFMRKEIRNKLTTDMVELRAYYNEHEHKYDRPARMSWREVEISVARHPDRAEALKLTEAIHARLAKGEDFASVARAASEGPTAGGGGLYADITPGGYGIAPVNEVLGRLPVGQLSGVIEAPSSFHIVRIESRRDAGPLRFDEVQDEVKREVFNKNLEKAVLGYLEKLRARTLIRTMYDAPDAGTARVQTASKR